MYNEYTYSYSTKKSNLTETRLKIPFYWKRQPVVRANNLTLVHNIHKEVISTPSWRSIDHFRGPQQTPAIFAKKNRNFRTNPLHLKYCPFTVLLHFLLLTKKSRQQTANTTHETQTNIHSKQHKKTCLLSE